MSLPVRGRSFAALLLLAAGALFPSEGQAAPDPTIASLLSAGSTVLPVALGTALLATGRGASEGIRFDLGLAGLSVGAAVGPSVGQIYGSGGTDALVTFVLRTITTAVFVGGIGLHLRGSESAQGTGTALAVVGGIPTGLLAIYDVFAAADSAREARLQARQALRRTPDMGPLSSILGCGPIPCATGSLHD